MRIHVQKNDRQYDFEVALGSLGSSLGSVMGHLGISLGQL